MTSGGEVTVSGRVIDGAGRPAAGVRVAGSWSGRPGRWEPSDEGVSDAGGRFQVKLDWARDAAGLLALNEAQTLGAAARLDTNTIRHPLELVLMPTVPIAGEFTCERLGEPPSWCSVEFRLPGRVQLAEVRAEPPRFSVRLPPGRYEFVGSSTYTDYIDRRFEFTVTNGVTELNLGKLDLTPTPIGLRYGKPAPPWRVTAARGVSPQVQPNSFRGKWLLVEFWGFW